MKRLVAFAVFSILTSSHAGLIAYYPFNGSAQDESGNGHDGIVQGATLVADRFGNPASAYSFNGTNAFITANIANLPAGIASRTMTGWIRNRTVQRTITSVIGYGSGNQSGQFGLGISGPPNRPYLFNFFWKGYTMWFPDLPIPTNAWYFAAVTYTNQQITLWRNGEYRTWNVDLTTANNGKFFVGACSVNGQTPSAPAGSLFTTYFLGEVDDVRLYDTALTAEEIQQIYELESGPRINLIKAVKPEFVRLSIGTNYQMQVSADMANWTNYGSPFTAIGTNMIWSEYFDVDNWNSLFFRLQLVQ